MHASHTLEVICRWQHSEYKTCMHLQSGALWRLLQALQLAEQLLLVLHLLLGSAAWQASLGSS